MMRRRLLMGLSLVALVGFPIFAQSAVQIAAQGATVGGTETAITTRYVDTPLAEALKDVAVRAGVKVNFSQGKLPAGARVTATLERVTIDEAFARLLRGTTLHAVRVSGKEWVVTPGSVRKVAGQGVINGKVIDAKSGRGISGASVSIGGGSPGTVTDANGSYRLVDVPAGTQVVSVRYVGYAKQARSITVGEEATVTVDFKLEPSANVLDQVVVTGTVVATELKAVPNAITVITARQIEERGITRIDQLFRGDIPGLFTLNSGSSGITGAVGNPLDQVTLFSRGATSFDTPTTGAPATSMLKTYLDGVELASPSYISQIDPKSIERIEILTGPQASTIYGSNAINGVIQIFTKRSSSPVPQVNLRLLSGLVQSQFSSALTPQHDYSGQINGTEGRVSYNAGGSWNYIGAWTPSKQTARTTGFGGTRIQFDKFTGDFSGRLGITRNNRFGGIAQGIINNQQNGLTPYTPTVALSAPETSRLSAHTWGVTIGYTPVSWWSNEVTSGTDVSNIETLRTRAGFISAPFDSTLNVSRSSIGRNSARYSTTVKIPLSSMLQGILTSGTEGWNTIANSLNTASMSLTGTLVSPPDNGTPTLLRIPDHNRGAFVQGQLGFRDALFLTYGLRAEWNPNYGDEAQPNLAPRYGIAYTHDVGVVSVKVRGSYGRSTRPPLADDKKAVLTSSFVASLYGPFNMRAESPELEPVFQQGGEGGIELYLGKRGSLVVTRYNQTVDNLIANPKVDSVRSLLPNPLIAVSKDVDGYGYQYVTQNLNIGSIRNQGWELQGSINTGPFTTTGTYSWTKSRIIGITPKYRSVLTGTQYRVGAPFMYLPEHTWAIVTRYANLGTIVSLNVNGVGFLYRVGDDIGIISSARLDQIKPRVSFPPITRTKVGEGYAMADLNATRKFTARFEGLLQIQNLANFYQNDYSSGYAVLGRQSKVGINIRL